MSRRGWLIRLCCVLALAVASVSAVALAATSARVEHLRFTRVPRANHGVIASGDYSLLERGVWKYEQNHYNLVAVRLTLVDQRSGKRAALRPSKCSGGGWFGGGWLGFSCYASSGIPEVSLYDLSTRRWRTVPAEPNETACGHELGVSCQIVALGRDWIQLLAGLCDGCQSSYLLENIRTREVIDPPVTPGGRDGFALSAASGYRRLCSPLRYPASHGSQAGAATPGWLSFYGKVALVSGAAPAWGKSTFAYLQRCGSSRRLKLPPGAPLELTDSLSGSSHVVVWRSGTRTLSGVFLPSLRKFRVPLNISRVDFTGITTQLNARYLYVFFGEDSVAYSAPIP